MDQRTVVPGPQARPWDGEVAGAGPDGGPAMAALPGEDQ